MKKQKEYRISLICDEEITSEVIDAFKFKDVTYKKIQSGTPFGTEFIIYIKKD